MAVYLDLVILLNFLVDFLLLLGTNRLLGSRGQALRCALGAALGGVYAGACMLHGFRFLGNAFWRFCALGLMALCAFGLDKSAWKKSGVFLLLSMALGGIAGCESGVSCCRRTAPHPSASPAASVSRLAPWKSWRS